MVKRSLNGEKAWFMAPIEYSLNEKGIKSPMNYTFMVNSPNGIYNFMKNSRSKWRSSR